MYAIVDVKDKQFKVREDDTLYVPYHSDAEADQELTLDRVLLVSDGDGDVTLGTPTVEDASISARVMEHVKGDKVIVFKKKRRKRYRVKRGHRQQYTQIQIESLNVNGASSSEAADEDVEADADTETDEDSGTESPETEAPSDEADDSEGSDEMDETDEPTEQDAVEA
jgi:large subunit ribosomal protein L21